MIKIKFTTLMKKKHPISNLTYTIIRKRRGAKINYCNIIKYELYADLQLDSLQLDRFYSIPGMFLKIWRAFREDYDSFIDRSFLVVETNDIMILSTSLTIVLDIDFVIDKKNCWINSCQGNDKHNMILYFRLIEIQYFLPFYWSKFVWRRKCVIL